MVTWSLSTVLTSDRTVSLSTSDTNWSNCRLKSSWADKGGEAGSHSTPDNTTPRHTQPLLNLPMKSRVIQDCSTGDSCPLRKQAFLNPTDVRTLTSPH